MNAFVDPDVLNITCKSIHEAVFQCNTDITCEQKAVQDLFNANSIHDIYVWLHFDVLNADYVYEQCADFVEAFIEKKKFTESLAGIFSMW